MTSALQASLVFPTTSSPCILQGATRAHRYRDSRGQMSFSERLKIALTRAGMTQTDLAKRLDVSAQTVQQWAAGKTTPRSKRLEDVAAALRASPQWLLLGEGKAFAGGEHELVMHETEIIDQDTPPSPDEIDLPCFREVEFAAGEGRTQVIENHGHTMRFSLSRLARAGVNPNMAACATASGKSMEPTILDGSPIGIDKGTTHVIDGKIYALDHGGMLRIKRLYKMPLGKIRLVSDNADEYPEEIHGLMGPDAPRIIGRVFWWEVFD